jgi:hypothetical protein
VHRRSAMHRQPVRMPVRNGALRRRLCRPDYRPCSLR